MPGVKRATQSSQWKEEFKNSPKGDVTNYGDVIAIIRLQFTCTNDRMCNDLPMNLL